jgi:hypothetical protein
MIGDISQIPIDRIGNPQNYLLSRKILSVPSVLSVSSASHHLSVSDRQLQIDILSSCQPVTTMILCTLN